MQLLLASWELCCRRETRYMVLYSRACTLICHFCLVYLSSCQWLWSFSAGPDSTRISEFFFNRFVIFIKQYQIVCSYHLIAFLLRPLCVFILFFYPMIFQISSGARVNKKISLGTFRISSVVTGRLK